MFKSVALSLFFTSFMFSAFAQNEDDESEETDTKTLAFGATTSNYTGLIGGFIARSSTPIGQRNGKTVYQYIAIELQNIKSPKEYAEYNGFGPKFIFGKRNYLFTLRPQYGREFTLFSKSQNSGIGLGLITAVGPSIGFLKPYYVKYENMSSFVQYDPNISENIIGVGGWFKNGFRGIKINPGLNAKVAANIDMNTFGDSVTGLEIGSAFEFFFKEPEIMASAFSDNPQTFVSVYLTLYFGSKKPVKKKTDNGIN